MAAISSAILAICNSGDHVVCSNCVYGGTFAFMKTYLPLKAGIIVSFVDITDLEAVKAAFTSKTKVRQPCPFQRASNTSAIECDMSVHPMSSMLLLS
jgi:hypothetical protein